MYKEIPKGSNVFGDFLFLFIRVVKRSKRVVKRTIELWANGLFESLYVLRTKSLWP